MSSGTVLLEWPILTGRARKRVAIVVEVPRLHEVLPRFTAESATLDHVYDF